MSALTFDLSSTERYERRSQDAGLGCGRPRPDDVASVTSVALCGMGDGVNRLLGDSVRGLSSVGDGDLRMDMRVCIFHRSVCRHVHIDRRMC